MSVPKGRVGAQPGPGGVGLPCTRTGRGAQPLSSVMPSIPEKVTEPTWRKWWASTAFLRVRTPGEPWGEGTVQRCLDLRSAGLAPLRPPSAHYPAPTWEMCWMAAVRGSSSVWS